MEEETKIELRSYDLQVTLKEHQGDPEELMKLASQEMSRMQYVSLMAEMEILEENGLEYIEI